MYVPAMVALVLLLVLSLALATPNRKQGCLIDIGHILALIVGSLTPALIAWLLAPKSSTPWWFWLLALLSLLLGACAMGLAAFGWQTFFPGWIVVRERKKRGRKSATRTQATPDLEKQVDLSLFDPSAYMVAPQSLASSANSDPFGDCLFALFVGILGGLFWLGLQLAQGITRALLPVPAPVSTETGQGPSVVRIVRALLCFLYAFAIVALTTIALYNIAR